jgi:CheY-like chemotaxis protein
MLITQLEVEASYASSRCLNFQRVERAQNTTDALTILYAEDFEPVRDALKEKLERAGWRVEACSDGETALAWLESPRSYALLIFDKGLPGISGLELTRRARSLVHRRNTPVVMLSGSESEAEARKAGANVFLRKPQDIRLLIGTVSRLVKP